MSWIKYYTLTSTCLYLLSFNLAPVWCFLSRQTVFSLSLSLCFQSGSEKRLFNWTSLAPRLLFGQNNPVVNLWRNIALGLGNLPFGWLYLGWRCSAGEERSFQEIYNSNISPSVGLFQQNVRCTRWLLNIGALVNLDLCLFKFHHIVQLVPAGFFFFMDRGIDTWRSLCAALYCKSTCSCSAHISN